MVVVSGDPNGSGSVDTRYAELAGSVGGRTGRPRFGEAVKEEPGVINGRPCSWRVSSMRSTDRLRCRLRR